MKHKTLKHIISITISMMLIFSSCILAFADDETTASDPGEGSTAVVEYPQSALQAIISDEDIIEYDNLLREVAYQTAVRSSGDYNYDAGDIYNLLWQTLVGNGSYYVKVYDNNTYNLYNSLITQGLMSSILSTLQSIDASNVYQDGIVRYTTSSLLYAIANSVTSNNTNTLNGLFDSNNNSYLGLIYTNQVTFNSLFNSFATNSLNELHNISTNTSNISFNTSNISSNTTTIASNTSHIDSDLHDIKQWLDDTFYFDEETVITQELLLVDNLYLVESDEVRLELYNNNNALRFYNPGFTVPMSFANDIGYIMLEFDFGNNVIPNINDITFTYNAQNYYYAFDNYQVGQSGVRIAKSSSLLQNLASVSTYYVIDNKLYVVFEFDLRNANVYSDLYTHLALPFYKSPYTGIIIDCDNPTTLKVTYREYTYTHSIIKKSYIEHIDNDLHSMSDILNVFKEIYASDDLIASKEAQKPLEDSVLEDFTGSGSASASVADAIDIKGVQSSVKGSLDTGNVQASGLSTILNTSNPTSNTSFFTFFTQAVYNDVNGINTIPQTRDVYYHIDDSALFNDLVGEQSW